jgi:uncharacterized protein YcbK (DUF882 family)
MTTVVKSYSTAHGRVFWDLKGIKMRNKKVILYCCAFFLLGLTCKNLFAQWNKFKKGLRKEVQVAVESDTMLVAHHDKINFSFIATTNKTPGSDIYREIAIDSANQELEIWKTTERFWQRLRQTRNELKALFKEPFLADLRHPETSSVQIDDDPAGTTGNEAQVITPPKSLVERIHEAREKGDFEVASLLLVMLKEKDRQSPDTTGQHAHEELQQQLRQEQAVLEKLYTFAYEYEQAGDWEMAAAVYENLLELGEYQDTRMRLDAVLSGLQQMSDDENLRKKYKAGLAAVALQEWGSAANIFESILAIQPEYRNARVRLSEAKAALEKPDSPITDFYTNGRARGYDLGNRTPYKQPALANDPQKIHQYTGSIFENDATDRENKLTDLYDDALRKISQQDWANAHYILEIIESEKSDYKNTHQLLQLVQANMPSRQGYLIYWAGGLMIIITLMGLAIISLDFRAVTFSLFRQYKKAAEIYRRQLEVNPGRLKLYGKLAIAYFKSGRADEEAIRVYAMIEKLNLQCKHKGQIQELLKTGSTN